MRWIKANEMGPDLKYIDTLGIGKKFSDKVLCLDEDGEPHVGILTYIDGDFLWEFDCDHRPREVDEVTYWAPIPKPPK